MRTLLTDLAVVAVIVAAAGMVTGSFARGWFPDGEETKPAPAPTNGGAR